MQALDLESRLLLKTLFNQLRTFFALLLITRNLKITRELVAYGVYPFYLLRRANGLWLAPLGLSLESARQWPWLLGNLNSAIKLKSEGRTEFYNQQQLLGFDINDLKLVATTAEEIFTATEVFVENVYRFFPSCPVVVLDIGMNVGYASLQFATMQNVTAVYSFEPFPKTYAQALFNIGLNPVYASKIHSKNVGLAGSDREMTVGYQVNLKGSAGIYNRGGASDGVLERIELRSAVAELNSIICACPNLAIVVKMDCEAAEYEILEAWNNQGCLSKLSMIMIEWHRFHTGHQPAKLCEWLTAAGFTVFAKDSFSGCVGMLYAVRDAAGG